MEYGRATGERKVNLGLTSYGQILLAGNETPGKPMNLAKYSIAAKLYAIFALLATVMVALAMVAIVNAGRHVTLTKEFESAFIGAENVERINSLVYAVVMESRG
jgi:hypothetical protein